MSKMKQFARKVSMEMGYDGELNPEVMKEADRRLFAIYANIEREFHATQDNERSSHGVSQRFGKIICEISEED